MSEQEQGNLAILNESEQQKVAETSKANTEQSPSIMKLVGRRINAAIRSVMPPRR